VTNDVAQNHDIEWTFGQSVTLDVDNPQVELRMTPPRKLDHSRRNIDANASRRLDRCQQIAESTTHFENSAARNGQTANESPKLRHVVAIARFACPDFGKLVITRDALAQALPLGSLELRRRRILGPFDLSRDRRR